MMRSPRIRVALDAMGSDHCPASEVGGALLAHRELPDVDVILVGPPDQIRKEARRQGVLTEPPFRIVPAEEWVTMEDKPSEALKRKPRSSMAVALELVRDGKADAFVSAGNTGAVMGFSLRILGRLKGIKRPAIAAVLPSLQGPTLLLDVGANTDPKPRYLVEFAVMGEIFARVILGKDRPRVAFLSIGEEDAKGNERLKEAKPLLERIEHIRFIGNVEGNDILHGRADVVVTDGFTGNAILKFGESVIQVLSTMVKNQVKRDPLALLGALLLRGALRRVKRSMDYEEYGGAPLLGVNGTVIIAHGRSTPRAIKNAIRTASRLAAGRVEEKILEELRTMNTRSAGQEGSS